MVDAGIDNAQQQATTPTPELRQGILLLDRDGRITFANPVAVMMLSGRSRPLPGRHFTDIWDVGHWCPGQWQEEAHQFEMRLQLPNGRLVPATVSITCLDNGELTGWLVLLLTNADFGRINPALFHTQKLAGIGTLAASVAHELNNPISIIISTCNNLQSVMEDNALTHEGLVRYVEMIEQSAWRSARIVEGLQTYAHRTPSQTKVANLNQIITDALSLVANSLQDQNNVTIKTSLAPSLPPFVGDQNQITQVLINLLTNARDALQPEGGIIRVSSAMAEAEEMVTFAVADSGPGIEPALMDRIFEPFFTTKPVGEGTGLGLSIAAGIIERHGGRIRVANQPEGGAVFMVALPCG